MCIFLCWSFHQQCGSKLRTRCHSPRCFTSLFRLLCRETFSHPSIKFKCDALLLQAPLRPLQLPRRGHILYCFCVQVCPMSVASVCLLLAGTREWRIRNTTEWCTCKTHMQKKKNSWVLAALSCFLAHLHGLSSSHVLLCLSLSHTFILPRSSCSRFHFSILSIFYVPPIMLQMFLRCTVVFLHPVVAWLFRRRSPHSIALWPRFSLIHDSSYLTLMFQNLPSVFRTPCN